MELGNKPRNPKIAFSIFQILRLVMSMRAPLWSEDFAFFVLFSPFVATSIYSMTYLER